MARRFGPSDMELLDYAQQFLSPAHYATWLREQPEDHVLPGTSPYDLTTQWLSQYHNLASGEAADYLDDDDLGSWSEAVSNYLVYDLHATPDKPVPASLVLRAYEAADHDGTFLAWEA